MPFSQNGCFIIIIRVILWFPGTCWWFYVKIFTWSSDIHFQTRIVCLLGPIDTLFDLFQIWCWGFIFSKFDAEDFIKGFFKMSDLCNLVVILICFVFRIVTNLRSSMYYLGCTVGNRFDEGRQKALNGIFSTKKHTDLIKHFNLVKMK